MVNADALASLPLLGVRLDTSSAECSTIPAGSVFTVTMGGKTAHAQETHAVRVCPVAGAFGHEVLATAGGRHLAYRTNAYKGSMIILASSGMSAMAVVSKLGDPSASDTALANPYPMSDYARALLDAMLLAETPFIAGTGLTVVVNRVNSTQYLVAVSNPSLVELPFKIESNVGVVSGIAEIQLQDQDLGPSIMALNLTGYTPPGQHSLGSSTATAIAGLDQRIFTVTLLQETAALLATVVPVASPNRIALPLLETSDLTEDIMLRSTFKQHFDAVIVDWKYVDGRSVGELQRQGRWAYMR
jgi:hypothetical protein